ncbi:MAG: VOC family protein [Nonomuraea sp.]|nr:VOC family protein [Nonomuraea sp.]
MTLDNEAATATPPTLDLELDHIVLVAQDVERTMAFYTDVLGGTPHRLAEWRSGSALYPSVLFGPWKINIHPAETPAAPRAASPSVGAADFCLRFPGPVAEAIELLDKADVPIVHGPAKEECAREWRTSVYFRDPDGCLVEFACELEERR